MSFPPQGLDKADILSNQATLLTRLSAARAGYLDELAAANLPADIDTLLSRLTAARAGYIDSIYDALHHASYIFPDDTDLSLTLTAGQAVDTWGAWAEMIDSGANNLSSLFTSNEGHLSVIQEEELSDINTVYMVQFAYGDAKVHLTEQRFAGSGKFQNPSNLARIFGKIIPAGEKVYYRMKSNTASADTAEVHIRYHIH